MDDLEWYDINDEDYDENNESYVENESFDSNSESETNDIEEDLVKVKIIFNFSGNNLII